MSIQGKKIDSLLDSLKELLKKEGRSDFIRKIDMAVSAGSTGTEIYVLLRGVLIDDEFKSKMKEYKIDKIRKDLVKLIDDALES